MTQSDLWIPRNRPLWRTEFARVAQNSVADVRRAAWPAYFRPMSHVIRAVRSVCVLGATGLVGTACVRMLADDSTIDRIQVLARRQTVHRDLKKVDERIVDFEIPDRWSGTLDADAVVCALGTTIRVAGSREQFRRVDFDMVVNAARIARQNGATCFVLVSSYGADAGSLAFYYRVKGEVEQAIREIGFDATYILRPSMLLGRRRPLRPVELIGKCAMVMVAPLLPRRIRPIDASIVARCAVSHLHEPTRGFHVVESEAIRLAGSPPQSP